MEVVKIKNQIGLHVYISRLSLTKNINNAQLSCKKVNKKARYERSFDMECSAEI